MLDSLMSGVAGLGKSTWQAMLHYTAVLHKKCIHSAQYPLPYEWEEIGTGYCYGPGFGHWDIVHAMWDEVQFEPEHDRKQILNNLALQQADGLIEGCVYIRDNKFNCTGRRTVGHPPLWQTVVDEYCRVTASNAILPPCYAAIKKLIRWFEENRAIRPAGFYYLDARNTKKFESGIDEGIRFLNIGDSPFSCVDATSHMYSLYRHADQWGKLLGIPGDEYGQKADELREFIQNRLFCPKSGFFHDDRMEKCLSFEGMWPVVVGAATPEQANRVIDDNLLNPNRFFTPHPISTVSQSDGRFELRMWRGPAWNSMTYWAARGCMRYGRADAAKLLLENALDSTAEQFARTGTIWEFYHPFKGEQTALQRKPERAYNTPCRDYLGHNPLIAMALLWEKAR